jgi:hypothetical protein
MCLVLTHYDESGGFWKPVVLDVYQILGGTRFGSTNFAVYLTSLDDVMVSYQNTVCST